MFVIMKAMRTWFEENIPTSKAVHKDSSGITQIPWLVLVISLVINIIYLGFEFDLSFNCIWLNITI
jgi:hypothetical protein